MVMGDNKLFNKKTASRLFSPSQSGWTAWLPSMPGSCLPSMTTDHFVKPGDEDQVVAGGRRR
jgi:hypothetical protein